MSRSEASPFQGIAAGVAAGLVAGLAMNLFQKAWSAALPSPASDGDPATVKAAQKASIVATGAPLNEESKEAAGNATHYLFGALVGGAYGLAAELWPAVTKGYGTLFGAAATTIDELGVPAAGLSDAPSQIPALTHAYALASHVVFGGVAEATRRLLRAG